MPTRAKLNLSINCPKHPVERSNGFFSEIDKEEYEGSVRHLFYRVHRRNLLLDGSDLATGPD
jgi:hypothetical protein